MIVYLLILHLLAIEADIEELKATQLVSIDDKTLQLSLHPDGVQLLRSHADRELYFIGIHGGYRTGKSTLLNEFAQATAFQVDDGADPVTRGLWIYMTDVHTQKGARVVLVDSEGSGSFRRGVGSFDSKLATIVSTISSVLLMNVHDVVATPDFHGLFDQTSIQRAMDNRWKLNCSKTGIVWVIQQVLITGKQQNVSDELEQLHQYTSVEEVTAIITMVDNINNSFSSILDNDTYSVTLPRLNSSNRSASVHELLRAITNSSHCTTKRINGANTSGIVAINTIRMMAAAFKRHTFSTIDGLLLTTFNESALDCVHADAALTKELEESVDVFECVPRAVLSRILRQSYTDNVNRCLSEVRRAYATLIADVRISSIINEVRRLSENRVAKVSDENDAVVTRRCRNASQVLVSTIKQRLDNSMGGRYETPAACRLDLERNKHHVKTACSPRVFCSSSTCVINVTREMDDAMLIIGDWCDSVSPVAIGAMLYLLLQALVLGLLWICTPRRGCMWSLVILAAWCLIGNGIALLLYRDGDAILTSLVTLNNRNVVDGLQLLYSRLVPEWANIWLLRVIALLTTALITFFINIIGSLCQQDDKQK